MHICGKVKEWKANGAGALHGLQNRRAASSRLLVCSIRTAFRQILSREQMEPSLHTPQGLASVAAELSGREPIFHRPEFGTTRSDFEKMTADDFWEVGASGRRYSRA